MVDVVTFCGNCGSPQGAAGDRYCRKCGRVFDQPAGVAGAAPSAVGSTYPGPPPAPPYRAYQPSSPSFFRPQTTNGLAVASLVLGILWLYWIGSILALVFGYIARAQIRRSNGAETGKGLAIAGIVLGWLEIGALVVVFAVGLLIVAAGKSTARSNSQPIAVSALRQDAAAKADLRNALTAEKVHYADTREYSAAAATMLQIEPDSNWDRVGGPQVFVRDVRPGDHGVVCIQEAPRPGTVFAVADVATGSAIGTYYVKASCSTGVQSFAGWSGW